ncbi:IS630 family transposase [Archaeoglobus sp.]
MPRKPKVIKHIPKEELEEKYKREKNPVVKERLLAILLLYDGKNIYEVAEILRKCERTIKEWLSRWNGEGYERLFPRGGRGRKPKLSDEEWDKILKEIEGKGMTIKEVAVYVKTTRGVEYAYKTVWKILRKKKEIRYGKPYVQNERRPENAEEILKKRVNEVLSKVEDPIIAFLDESSIRLNPNRIRVVNTPVVKYREGEKKSKTIFGFMALNGNDVVILSDKSKAEDMVAFLGLIRRENPERPICIILDNARIHHARIVKERAEELNIHLIYLPPYCPDLNPIEIGWGDLMRELARFLDFDEMVERSIEVALDLFGKRKHSYASYWVEEFIG